MMCGGMCAEVEQSAAKGLRIQYWAQIAGLGFQFCSEGNGHGSITLSLGFGAPAEDLREWQRAQIARTLRWIETIGPGAAGRFVEENEE